MCNWTKWVWPGIFATIFLTALAMLMQSKNIENDLTAKAADELSAQHSWASVELDGRDLTLTGMAPSQEAQSTALKLADDAYDVRIANNSTTLIALANPFKLSALKDGNTVTLTGYVPNEAVRGELKAAALAASPNATIIDETVLARGAPAGFAALSVFGISQLKGLVSGKASTDNLNLSVSGLASNLDSYDGAVSTLAGAIPSSGKVVMAKIDPPLVDQYNFSAKKNEDSVVLTGYYPDEKTHMSLVQSAMKISSSSKIVDNLKIAGGAPAGFAALSTFGIAQLKGLVTGEASMEKLKLSIVGKAKDADIRDKAMSMLSGSIPAGGEVVMAKIDAPIKVKPIKVKPVKIEPVKIVKPVKVEPIKISPYSVSVLKSKTSIVLNGYYPNEATHVRLVAAAKKANPSANLIDNLQFGAGAPTGFADLSVKTISQLNRFSAGFVKLNDKAVTIRGTAKSPKSYDNAVASAAGKFPAQGNVTDVKIKRSMASPFMFTASKKDGSLVLGGHVGSSADKNTIVAYSASRNENGSNRASLDIVRGQPASVDWSGAMETAVFGVSQLRNGSAKLEGNAYSIQGKALTDASYDIAVKTGKSILSKGIKSVKVDISRPPISPYKWQYSRTGESSTAALSGHVPSKKLSFANGKQIADALGTDAKIYNVLKVGSGQPRGFAAATSVAINTASRLIDGRATIVDTNVFVKGEALTENAAVDTRRQIENSLPPGFSGKHAITVRKAPVIKDCPTEVSKVFVSNSIKFEIASDKINDVSRGLLDRLAAVSTACRFSELTIEGHTDADGAEEYNQGLSEARAKTVRSYLAFNGYLLGNMKTIGYGESKPIAPNNTQDGKALNRRINILVSKN